MSGIGQSPYLAPTNPFCWVVFCSSDTFPLLPCCSPHFLQLEFSILLATIYVLLFNSLLLNQSLLLTSLSHNGLFPFEYWKYWSLVSFIFYLLLQPSCYFLLCYLTFKILWTIKLSNCIRTKGLVSNLWSLCSNYRRILGRF